MAKRFKKVPVYTKDLISFNYDDRKKQDIIDKWTDALATKMASKTRVAVKDNGSVVIDCYSPHNGGHNRQTIEMLNDYGYVVKIFLSVAEAGKYLHIQATEVSRYLNGKRKKPLKPGYFLRRRETKEQRTAREKAAAIAIKKKNKTTSKNKRNYGKGRKTTT